MSISATTRVDLHCHSTASELAKLGVARSLGLPECATPPEEVYELAKRRGMDFVTITDHDTIDGCLTLADRPDCFISEELTAHFAGQPQAVHVLCYGIEPDDHDWLQEQASDLEECVAYMNSRGIVFALAHPFYDVAAALTPTHRRRLAELFGIWEIRNGSRAPELNRPAQIIAEAKGITGIAGSDDHAGVDLGRTYTETPAAATPAEFLNLIQAGRAAPCGIEGGAAKWAHAAIALAARTFAGASREPGTAPDPAGVYRIATRVVSEASARSDSNATDLDPADGLALLDAWLESVGLDLEVPGLIAHMQADDFTHEGLYRRARRVHADRLGAAIPSGIEKIARGELEDVPAELFAAAIPAVPYVAAAALVGREKARLVPRREGRLRVAVAADGIASVHGVSHTIAQIRERGVPGFDVDVIGTDSRVDRRLPSVADFDLPFYEGLRLGVPALPDLVEVLAEGGYDLLHVTAPGPVGVLAVLLADTCGVPVAASHHTELARYAQLRAGNRGLDQLAEVMLGAFYRQAEIVMSPSEAADVSLRSLGIDDSRLARWERGVDTDRFRPALARRLVPQREITVLYVGRISHEKGVDLMAESFLRARSADPRLRMLVVGRGPEEDYLLERLGDAATLLGWRDGGELARAYGLGDIFLFCSRTDTYGQVVMEAAASGLPVVAVNEGGPASLVDHRSTGFLCEADADEIACALLELADSAELRRDLGIEGRRSAMERSWERSMDQLAEAYRLALGTAAPVAGAPVPDASPEWHTGSPKQAA